MTQTAHRWRMAAGIGVLLVLILVAFALVPAYVENIELQRYLDSAVERNSSPDALVADVVNAAARLGLPVRAGDVKVTRVGNALRVDIIYIIRVDLPLYTVDLHFHPSAGG